MTNFLHTFGKPLAVATAGISSVQATDLIPQGTTALDLVKVLSQIVITIVTILHIRKQKKSNIN